MAVFSIGSIELLLLLLFGGGPPVGMLSLPPLPEDAVLLRMAPEKCVYYLAWAGMAPADPKSANHTERLLAEEEVRRFARTLTEQLVVAAERSGPRNPQTGIFAQEIPKLVQLALTRPGSVFVSDISLGKGPPDVRGGLIVNVGKQASAVTASIAKLERAALGNSTSGPWHRIPAPPGGQVVEWGLADEYLIVGIGPKMAEQIAARRGNPQTPEWLSDVERRLSVPRRAAVQFINTEAIVAALAPVTGPSIVGVLDTLGLSNVRAIISVSGLNEEGAVGLTLVQSDGAPTGVLKLLAGQPLRAEDLAGIPEDATFAVAVRLNANQFLTEVLELIGAIDRRGRDQLESVLDHIDAPLGLSLRDDLLQALGDTWTLHSAPSEGGLLMTGLTLSVSVRDHDRLAKSLDRLMALLRQHHEAGPPVAADAPRLALGEMKFRGQEIHFVQFVGSRVPLAPAWCLSEDHWSIAINPQALKAHLAGAKSGKSLADIACVKSQLQGGGAPQFLMYGDVPTVFRTFYPLVQLFAPIAAGELQRQGIAVDASLLPSAQAIAPHLMPTVVTFGRHENGFLLASSGTLPGDFSTPLAVLAPLALVSARAAPSQPAAAAAFINPRAAAEAQSTNNLRQLSLGAMNYHEANRKYPFPKKGAKNAGLSWRVHLLPYLEQDNLYRQFKLDEPWDSETNKKLIAAMPAIYRAPQSAVAEGKTVYLAPTGKGAVAPGDRELRIQDITDGTSNTILFVEARDDQAVIWTKPDDFDADAGQPLERLVGLREGGFLATFCDGSVRKISIQTKPDILQALFTRAGGELIPAEALSR